MHQAINAENTQKTAGVKVVDAETGEALKFIK